MPTIDHLKRTEPQNKFHTVAYGKHLATGHLAKSIVSGSSGSHIIKLQQMLGRGPWDGVEGVWFRGLNIDPSKYKFYPGIQSPGMGDATQGQDTVFNTDTPHSSMSWLRVELPSGVSDFDTKTSPPDGLTAICRTTKVDNYDGNGNVISNGFSTSPARQVADLIIRIGARPTSRIDWGAWFDWHDFMETTESQDYTTIAGFDGFGLWATFYNGTNFDTFVTSRIDPVIEYPLTAGSPAVGVNVDNFSVREEGKIRAEVTATVTFTLDHDDGARLWVDNLTTPLIDQWTTFGTHTATFAMTAGQLYDIKVDWRDTGGNAELRLKWSWPAQSTPQVVPPRALYPKPQTRPRYETNPFFSQPTRLDDAVRTILNLCNSTVQEVNGKLRFHCLEQLSTPSFHFTDAKIIDGSISVSPRNVSTMRNSWQAKFRDVDSQYLEEPLEPILVERPDLIEKAGRKIDGESIELFTCTRWQAHKTITNHVKREVDSKFRVKLTGNADTFPVLAGDKVKIDVEFRDWTEKEMLVLESNDSSAEQTADERPFLMQEWSL